MGVGVVLNPGSEIDVKVRKGSSEKSEISREVDFERSSRELRKDVAPATVP